MVDIFFGKVVDVNDTSKLNKVRVSIPGYTDLIPTNKLSWYFPFFGQNYLPEKDDEVGVIIFDYDFTRGFYSNKLDINAVDYEDSEYRNYLELYNRLGVELKYTESRGIEFKNNSAKVQIEQDQIKVITDNGIGVTINKSDGIVIEAMNQDVEINAGNNRVTMNNSGVQIKSSGKINLNGKFEALYNLIPGVPIADVSQIGISKKVTLM